jgi:hypothetical protein
MSGNDSQCRSVGPLWYREQEETMRQVMCSLAFCQGITAVDIVEKWIKVIGLEPFGGKTAQG